MLTQESEHRSKKKEDLSSVLSSVFGGPFLGTLVNVNRGSTDPPSPPGEPKSGAKAETYKLAIDLAGNHRNLGQP